MKKFSYIALVRWDSPKANVVQIKANVKALVKQLDSLELVIPKSKANISDLSSNVNLVEVPVIDLVPRASHWPHPIQVVCFWILNISFAIGVCLNYFNLNKIYTRSKLVGTILALLGKSVVFEAHDSARHHFLNQISAKTFDRVICISKAIQRSWSDLGANTLYAPDGVDQMFFETVTKSQARKQFGLDSNKPIIMYTGSFFEWKGVDTLIDTSEKVDAEFLLLGPEATLDSNLRKQIKANHRVKLVGHVTHSDIPSWLAAADILVIPNSAKFQHSREDSSPLKLFEYLASGTPIVASLVPAISEIVDQTQVTFFEPDNSADLAKQLNGILLNRGQANTKAKKAKQFARNFTWDRRVKEILKAI